MEKSRKILWILYNIHHRQNPFKSISSYIVASRGYHLECIENTIPVLLFTANYLAAAIVYRVIT
jgi:hypothetical protein